MYLNQELINNTEIDKQKIFEYEKYLNDSISFTNNNLKCTHLQCDIHDLEHIIDLLKENQLL